MKKLFLLLTLLVLPLIKSQAQIQEEEFFWSLFSNKDVSEWETYDNNKDYITWAYVTEGERFSAFYSKFAATTADDALISVPFKIKSLENHTIHFEWKCTKGMEFSVMLYDENDSCTQVSKITCSEDDADFKEEKLNFTVDSLGEYRLGFLVKGLSVEEGAIWINNVIISYDARPELMIESIEEIKAGYRKTDDKLVINVKNNSIINAYNYTCKYSVNGGAPIDLDSHYYQIDKGQYAKLGSENNLIYDRYGENVIEVFLTCEGDTVASNDTMRIVVDNREYTEMPYFEDFENLDYDFKIKAHKYYGLTWEMTNGESNDDYSKYKDWGNFMTCGHSEDDSTDWLFLPPVKLEPGYYAVEFDYIDIKGEGLYIDVCYGDTATYEGMTNKIGNINWEGMLKSHAFLPFYVSGAQDCIVGLHAKDYGGFYAIVDNIGIKAIEKPADDLVMLPITYDYNGTIREGFPFSGVRMTYFNNSIDKVLSPTFEVAFNGKEVFSKVEQINPLSEISRVINQTWFGEFLPGRNIFKGSVTCNEDKNPDNNSQEYDILNCKDPFLFYDFENGMPEGVELVVADDGISAKNPDNSAWYIGDKDVFNFNSVKSLTTSTKLSENVDPKADRWFIMPPVFVGNNGADIVWEDCYNRDDIWDFDHEFERYQILISTTDTSLESFKVLDEYKVENQGSLLRRIKLDEFAGNNVHIAFRAYSNSGQSLYIDNIGLYGDFEDMHTSVDKVAENSINVTVKGDMLNAGAVADRIDVIDIDGRIIATANNSSSLNIASLSSGVYMARVNVNGTVKTVKFVR